MKSCTKPQATKSRVKTLRVKTPSKRSRGKISEGKPSSHKPSRDKVRAYRKRMRAKGFRLVQMWLPDTRSPEFAAQAHRASLAIANSPTEQDDQAFVDSVQCWTSEENAE